MTIKNTIIGTALAVLLCGSAYAKTTAPKTHVVEAEVVRVLDGDTVSIKVDGKEEHARLFGIDCPETKINNHCKAQARAGGESCAVQKPKGLVAKERLKALLAQGPVSVTVGNKRDRYGRLLVYLDTFAQDIGLELLKEGLCEDVGAKYPHPRSQYYRHQLGK